MAGLSYQDFDLLIDRDGDRFRARVLASPGGQSTAAVRFGLPFSPLELENFLLRVGGRKRGIRSAAVADMARTVAGFGSRLFGAVFAGEIGECLQRSLALADRDDTGLRIRLHLADEPELADLPWEYLYDPGRRRFLCLSADTPLVRYLPLPDVARALSVDGPVRVLAVIANPDLPGVDRLDVEAEWANLQTATGAAQAAGQLVVRRLAVASLTELHRELGRTEFHVLHFIGHGRFNTNTAEGELLLAGPDGREQAISGTDLAVVLHDHRSLRLVVLNSCEGARSAVSDPFAGTAQTLLLQARVWAVVAMQFEISDRAAIAFSQGFYEAITTDPPASLDAAVAIGRTRIYTEANRIEWATPVLYTRATNTVLFTPSATASRTPLAPPDIDLAPPIPHTVGRRSDDVTRRAQPTQITAWGNNDAGQTDVPTGLADVTAIAAGTYHCLALHADGHLTGWGGNRYGQATVPAGLTGITAIAVGSDHCLALHADGHLTAWGDNRKGQATVPAGLTDVTAIAAGYAHNVVLHADGHLTAWGDNHFGQTAVPAGLTGITMITAGWGHSLALHADGHLTIWGILDPFATPLPAGLTDITAIASGTYHCLALHADGHLTAWGFGTDAGEATVPEGLDAFSAVTAMAASTGHNLALRADGHLTAWGQNESGQTNEQLSRVVDAAFYGLRPGSSVRASAA